MTHPLSQLLWDHVGAWMSRPRTRRAAVGYCEGSSEPSLPPRLHWHRCSTHRVCLATNVCCMMPCGCSSHCHPTRSDTKAKPQSHGELVQAALSSLAKQCSHCHCLFKWCCATCPRPVRTLQIPAVLSSVLFCSVISRVDPLPFLCGLFVSPTSLFSVRWFARRCGAGMCAPQSCQVLAMCDPSTPSVA